MDKEMKWMIIGMSATVFCLAVAITCAAIRNFDLVPSIMLGFVAVFSAVILFFLIKDIIAKSKEKQIKKDEEEQINNESNN